MALFKFGSFTLHDGEHSIWKIDCDALDSEDITTCAMLLAIKVGRPYRAVEGVPTGGLRLAKAMNAYAVYDEDAPLLIVDDVLTSGGSMEAHRAGRDALGAVIFARGPCPSWVVPLFST